MSFALSDLTASRSEAHSLPPFSNSTQYMSETLGMPYVDLGPSPHKNTWGTALISKFPILSSAHHLLPSPNGELAPAIFATLDVYGTEVDVVVSHNGQEEDPLDRELQSRKLGELMSVRWPNPAIFLGTSLVARYLGIAICRLTNCSHVQVTSLRFLMPSDRHLTNCSSKMAECSTST